MSAHVRCPECGSELRLVADERASDPREPGLLACSPFEDMDLSVRLRNGLRHALNREVNLDRWDESRPWTVRDAILLSSDELMATPNIGHTSRLEFRKWINESGLAEYAHPSWRLPAWPEPRAAERAALGAG